MTRFVPPGPLGFGGAPLGNLFATITESDATAALVAAWETGIRHFDTAPYYGFGLSERRMGEWLRQQPRNDFTLSTKVGRLLTPAPGMRGGDRNRFVDGLPFDFHFDYGAAATRRSIEDSLQRLGLASIDIVYIHDVTEDTHGSDWTAMFSAAMAGAARVLTELRTEGVIKAWGLGSNMVNVCQMALERADPDVFLVAGRYTLLDQTALTELLPACVRRGVKVVVGGPYNSGLLAGGGTFDYVDAPPALVERARRIGERCARFGVDLKAAALQFCAAHPAVATVIPGARNAGEVRENAAMMSASIPHELWAALKADALLAPSTPTPDAPTTPAS